MCPSSFKSFPTSLDMRSRSRYEVFSKKRIVVFLKQSRVNSFCCLSIFETNIPTVHFLYKDTVYKMVSVVKTSIIVALIGIAIYITDVYFAGGFCYRKDTVYNMASVVKISIVVALIGIAIYSADIYFAGGVCYSKVRLDGKTVIITGGNTGIGKETAIDLATRGAKVIIGCRSKERGENAVIDIKKQSGNDKVYLKLIDLSSFKSVRAFAKDVLDNEERLDILINNAGISMAEIDITEDGFEIQFQVNHLGHFLLTQMLIDLLKKSAPSRIINVSSLAHQWANISDFENSVKTRDYSATTGYRMSKLANIAYTKELSRRYSHSHVTAYSLHPGMVLTEIGRYFFLKYPYVGKAVNILEPLLRIPFKNSKEGAQTTICCAVEEGLEKFSGEYFSDCAVSKPSKDAGDDDFAKRLWDFSKKATNLETI